MAEVSRILAWGIDLPEYKGKTYRLGEPTQGVKAEYEQWLKKSAMEGCNEACEGLDDETKAQLRRIVLEDFGLKKYRWQGEKWQAAMKTDAGISHLMLLLLQNGENSKKSGKHPVTADLVLELQQDASVGPWLWGAIYHVSGLDPQMALLAGKAAISGAKTKQAEMEKKIRAMLAT